MADIFTKEDKDVAHFKSVRYQMVMPRESFRLLTKAKLWGVLERRLDDSNYDRLTQSTKGKDNKNMNDVSITDATVDNKNDTDSDTDNDTSIKKLTWNEHGLQSNYGDVNGQQQINYGDDDYKTDVSKSITLVNKLYK